MDNQYVLFDLEGFKRAWYDYHQRTVEHVEAMTRAGSDVSLYEMGHRNQREILLLMIPQYLKSTNN